MNYGLFLSFHSKENFIRAFKDLKSEAWVCESFTPFPVEETMIPDPEPTKNPVKASALIGAIGGLLIGFLMQWIANVLYSPMNIGGRPLNSWPAFVPVTWVMTVLCAGVSLYLTLWWKLKLPQPYHPVFNAKAFKLTPGHYGILIQTSKDHPTLPELEDLVKLGADSSEVLSC